MNEYDKFPNAGYQYKSDPFPSIEDDMINRDLASPQFAAYALRSEASRFMDIMNHLYPDTDLQRMARIIFDLSCQIDDQMERQP